MPLPIRFAALALTCLCVPSTPLFAQSKAGAAATGETLTPNLLPVQDYAVLDLGGSAPATPAGEGPLWRLTLDDQHRAAFARFDEAAYPSPATVRTWRQGMLGEATPFPRLVSGEWQQHAYTLGSLRADGRLVGDDRLNERPEGADPGNYFRHRSTFGFFGSGTDISDVTVPLPYACEKFGGGNGFHFLRSHVTTFTQGGGYSFTATYTRLDDPSGAHPPYYVGGEITADNGEVRASGFAGMSAVVSGAKTVCFDPDAPAYLADTGTLKFVREVFGAREQNDTGWALGLANGESYRLWDGGRFTDLGGGALGPYFYCLNDAGLLLKDAAYDQPRAGALWRGGVATPFTSLLVGTPWEKQIKEVQPLLLSNPRPADASFQVVTAVKDEGRDALVLWKNVPTAVAAVRRWDLARMRWPADVNIPWEQLGPIAASGVIAAIGDDRPLLLLPVEYRELQPAAGFDGQTDPHWLMVPQFGNNFARALTPASETLTLSFLLSSLYPDREFVTPYRTSNSPVTLTVHGTEVGDDHKVKLEVGEVIAKGGELGVAVKKFKPVRVVIHRIIQRDSTGGPNPVVRPDIGPDTMPTADAVQAYLNVVFGRQANVYFSVGYQFHICDYDANRNGILEMDGPGQKSELDVIRGFRSTDGSFDVYYVRSFYHTAPNLQRAVGIAFRAAGEAFIKDSAVSLPSLPLKVTAHEVGHLLGLDHPNESNDIKIRPPNSNPQERLMYSNGAGTEYRLLIKSEWDLINKER